MSVNLTRKKIEKYVLNLTIFLVCGIDTFLVLISDMENVNLRTTENVNLTFFFR